MKKRIMKRVLQGLVFGGALLICNLMPTYNVCWIVIITAVMLCLAIECL